MTLIGKTPVELENRPPARDWKLPALRTLLIILALAAWFGTQAMLGARPDSGVAVGDKLHDVLAPVNAYLNVHVWARHALLISSSVVIDILAVFLLLRSIFGKTIRPFLGLLILFALRQIVQWLCPLHGPAGMIWEDPGFPSLLVTYGVGNDLFFSGHTALAVFGAAELARLHRVLVVPAVLIALFEITTVLSLRAHWTMDVYAGAVTALLVATLVERTSGPVDGFLSRLVSRHR